jgi:transcriptional regulator with XRE-family HTH domain
MKVNGPTIVRRQLGRQMRRARESAGKSTADVAASKIVARATLHRIESGRFPVNPGIVLRLCMLYDVDPTTTRELNKLAEASHRRGWWEDAEKVLAAGFGFFLGLEAGAGQILTYEPDLVPGLLQTPDYVRAVSRAAHQTPDEDTVERWVAARMKRQQDLFGRTSPVRLRAVLGAAALANQVGGPEVMAEQLAHLHQMAEDERVDLRVLPWAVGAHSALAGGGFALMRYRDPDDPTVVYLESAAGGSYLEMPAQVDRYAWLFRDVYGRSTPIKEYQP